MMIPNLCLVPDSPCCDLSLSQSFRSADIVQTDLFFPVIKDKPATTGAMFYAGTQQ
jgi:hypothetical protein